MAQRVYYCDINADVPCKGVSHVPAVEGIFKECFVSGITVILPATVPPAWLRPQPPASYPPTTPPPHQTSYCGFGNCQLSRFSYTTLNMGKKGGAIIHLLLFGN